MKTIEFQRWQHEKRKILGREWNSLEELMSAFMSKIFHIKK
jgi:hypothetical protein